MKLVYLIVAHKNKEQLKLLINKLSDSAAMILIHLDNKSLFHKELSQYYSSKKNIIFINKRENVIWGGYSVVKATLNLIYFLQRTKNYYDYVILLSGQDFPIKTSKEIINFFKDNRGKQFISSHRIPFNKLQYNNGEDRIYYNWFIDEIGYFLSRKIYKIQKLLHIKRKFPFKYVPYYGSQFFSINKECVEYIIRFIDNHPSYEKYFKKTYCSDEYFFQTLIKNSPFDNKCINRNLHYFIFKKGSPSPEIIRNHQYPLLMSSDKLFARKFDMAIDSKVLYKLSQIC